MSREKRVTESKAVTNFFKKEKLVSGVANVLFFYHNSQGSNNNSLENPEPPAREVWVPWYNTDGDEHSPFGG